MLVTPHPICHDGAMPGMYLSLLSKDAGTNNCHIATPLRSTLFHNKQVGAGINGKIKIIVCVLTHICAGVWLTREQRVTEENMNHALEGMFLTIRAGGTEFGYLWSDSIIRNIQCIWHASWCPNLWISAAVRSEPRHSIITILRGFFACPASAF